MTPWPKEKLLSLLDDLEKFRPKGRAIAAFDADGTLWDTDLGEGLFQYQIDHKLVALPEDPWGHYNWMKANVGNPQAYLWLAQICKDVPWLRFKNGQRIQWPLSHCQFMTNKERFLRN